MHLMPGVYVIDLSAILSCSCSYLATSTLKVEKCSFSYILCSIPVHGAESIRGSYVQNARLDL